MIVLTKIDGSEILVNSDEIEVVEHSHDTIIAFQSGRKIIVREGFKEIIDRVAEFKQACQRNVSLKDQ